MPKERPFRMPFPLRKRHDAGEGASLDFTQVLRRGLSNRCLYLAPNGTTSAVGLGAIPTRKVTAPTYFAVCQSPDCAGAHFEAIVIDNSRWRIGCGGDRRVAKDRRWNAVGDALT